MRSFSIGPFHFIGDDIGTPVKRLGNFKAVTEDDLKKAGFSQESIDRLKVFEVTTITPKEEAVTE